MGMRNTPEVEFDEETVVLLMSMFQDMGNHIALQYAGSHLVCLFFVAPLPWTA